MFSKKASSMKKAWIPFLFLIVTIELIGCGKKNKSISEKEASKDSIICISIAPYHEFKPEWVKLVRQELEDFYGVETSLLPKAEMPDSCKRPYKKRYNAGGILQHLNVIKPKECKYILALTTAGIAIAKDGYKEWGILGLGSRPGPCCVVSTANMGKNENLLKERLVKVCLHEMGHCFGLPHCDKKDKRCLMRSAEGTVKTIDEEEKYLCKFCAGFLISKGLHLKENP